MLISIIIPVHKTILFFKSCVESALNQTYENIEIIIACNGTLEIEDCKRFLNINDPRIIYLKTESGRHNARNEALLACKGEWIQFLDYDDYLFSDKIAIQLKELKNFSIAQLSICQWKKFNDRIEEDYIFPFSKLFDESKISARRLVQKLGINGGFIATASWLVSKEFILGLKWLDSPNDDAVFLSEILKKSPEISVIPQILAGYRIHKNNTSSIRTKTEFDKIFKSWKVISKNLETLNVSELNRYLYAAYLSLILYSKELKGHKILMILSKVFYFGIKSGFGFSIFRDIKKKIFR